MNKNKKMKKGFIVEALIATLAVGALIGVYVANNYAITPPEIVVNETPAPEIAVREEVEDSFGAYGVSGGGTYRLKASIGTTDTTINLSSFKEPVSNIVYTMSYLDTAVAYGTIDPLTDRPEFISFTGITQNSDGSAILTGVTRGLTRTPQGEFCTASSTLAVRHPGQAVFILSDSPCHFAEYLVKKNDETITGTLTVPTPTSGGHAANKDYVDGIVNGGTVSMDRVIVSATAGETVSSGQILYYNIYEAEWRKADADIASTTYNVLLGIAQGAGTDGAGINGGILTSGLDTKQGSTLTNGQRLYLSGTAGATSTTAGTNSRILGVVKDNNEFYFDPLQVSPTLKGLELASTTDLIVSGTATTTTATTSLLYVGNGCQGCSSVTVFSASGTWAKPTLGNRVLVQAWGGGGGGARGSAGNDTAGGGGGGGYAENWFDFDDLASTVTVTIGTGGTGATTNDADGTAGGNSTFGAHLTAYGGGGGGTDGTTGAGGGGGGTSAAGTSATATTGGAGGGLAGGSAGGGDSTLGGGGGESTGGSGGGDGLIGGGGGGDNDGPGGASYLGGGGGGGGGNSPGAGGGSIRGGAGGAGATAGAAATAGTAPAGGGGGAEGDGGGSGGNGGAGMIIVTVF